MRVRYESFGGIISLDTPPSTIYVDQAYMHELGHKGSLLWNERKIHLSAPVTAHFAVTNRCPMSCQTCCNASGKSPADELTTAEVKGILDELARMRVFTVAFGGGEPLAHPDIFKLARHARRRKLTPTLTTNGFYVDERTARRCRIFSHVHVSLDGIGEKYKAVRGVDGFEHASRAIRLLKEKGVSVGVNTVLCRANYDHLEKLVKFVVALGVDDVIFLRLKPVGQAKSSYENQRLTPEQQLGFLDLVKGLTNRYGFKPHVDCAMMPFVYAHLPDRDILRMFAGEGCIGANEIIEISPNGSVRPCSFSSAQAGEALHLSEVWDAAPEFNRFRCWEQSAPEPCRSCRHLVFCRGGCRAVAEALTGDFNAPDPECPFVIERKK